MEIIKRYGTLILSTILTIAGYSKLKTSVSGGYKEQIIIWPLLEARWIRHNSI